MGLVFKGKAWGPLQTYFILYALEQTRNAVSERVYYRAEESWQSNYYANFKVWDLWFVPWNEPGTQWVKGFTTTWKILNMINYYTNFKIWVHWFVRLFSRKKQCDLDKNYNVIHYNMIYYNVTFFYYVKFKIWILWFIRLFNRKRWNSLVYCNMTFFLSWRFHIYCSES